MVSTQCPLCGKVINDKDLMNEAQAVDKHQKAVPDCKDKPVTASTSKPATAHGFTKV